MMEKVSQRIENLKKDDNLLLIDIIEYFWAKMDEVQQVLQIKPNVLVLNQFIQS